MKQSIFVNDKEVIKYIGNQHLICSHWCERTENLVIVLADIDVDIIPKYTIIRFFKVSGKISASYDGINTGLQKMMAILLSYRE